MERNWLGFWIRLTMPRRFTVRPMLRNGSSILRSSVATPNSPDLNSIFARCFCRLNERSGFFASIVTFLKGFDVSTHLDLPFPDPGIKTHLRMD